MKKIILLSILILILTGCSVNSEKEIFQNVTIVNSTAFDQNYSINNIDSEIKANTISINIHHGINPWIINYKGIDYNYQFSEKDMKITLNDVNLIIE